MSDPFKKIQAYTLGEMIVVMILTSIVVGLAFSVLRLVQQHMYGIRYNYNHHLELTKLETAFWIDFNRFPEAEYRVMDDVLVLRSPIDSVQYHFNDTEIVREKDTFQMNLKIKQFYFNGRTVDGGKIDALKLKTDKPLLDQELFVYKTNDANVFMD